MAHRRPALLIVIAALALAGPLRAAPPPKSCGPPVERVVAAALERAGLGQAQERSWRARLPWSALLPRLAGRLGQTRANGELLERSGSGGLDINNYLALRWDIRATWDLSRLVFDPGELRVAARARQNAKERQQLLERVVRLYFERCRLLEGRKASEGGKGTSRDVGARDGEGSLRDALELQRLTALLDGLSGGLISGAQWP